MRSNGKTARIIVAFALAGAMALPLCAHAAEVEQGTHDLEIWADVVRDGDEVISVVVPSSVSIVVETSVIDGRIMGMTTGQASITNSPNSQAPISVEINSITDAPVAGNKLLDFVNMAFIGQYRVPIAEGASQHSALFDRINPGEKGTLDVELAQKDETELVPAGAYNVKATLLVAQIK